VLLTGVWLVGCFCLFTRRVNSLREEMMCFLSVAPVPRRAWHPTQTKKKEFHLVYISANNIPFLQSFTLQPSEASLVYPFLFPDSTKVLTYIPPNYWHSFPLSNPTVIASCQPLSFLTWPMTITCSPLSALPLLTDLSSCYKSDFLKHRSNYVTSLFTRIKS